jgi:hypothetical protein
MKILLNKKPYRIETELTKMSEELQTQFVIWMLTGVSCEKAYTELKGKFGLKDISIHQVKRYWQGESPLVLAWQRFRKKQVTPVAWEMNRRSAIKKLEDPNLPFEERILIIKFLETGRFQKTKDAELSSGNPQGKKKELENEQTSTYDNPLDDDARLEEVRLAVFGPAPGEIIPDSSVPAQLPTPPDSKL